MAKRNRKADPKKASATAGDDTKVHRNSPGVWGTCTYHEYSARCPNRAATVRAHNRVVTGLLRPRPDQSFWFLPTFARLYFRQTQLPCAPDAEAFQTKDQLLWPSCGRTS